MNRPINVLALLFVLLLCACGQSGPLYLPGNPSEIQDPSTAPANDSEDEDQASDDDEN